jgi:hypothetical protein
MTKPNETKTYYLDGWVIVPPLSPWDVKHKDKIWPEMSHGTFAQTARQAWRKHCQTNLVPLDEGELSIRIQRWHDGGYRAKQARLEIYDE